MFYTFMESPVGTLLLAGGEDSLHFLSFPAGHKAFGPQSDWLPNETPFQEVQRQLNAYFAGDLDEFTVPVQLSGTAFQNSVWTYLASIPFGETRTYGQVAADLGRPKASRAVGAANGNNPIPIILPCHRVIGANGALTGFGGGLDTKQHLLKHEGALWQETRQIPLFGE
ncbi:MAG: methylated-DNA--[protein]-cysteine S-methyltransferase [Devosia sp.]